MWASRIPPKSCLTPALSPAVAGALACAANPTFLPSLQIPWRFTYILPYTVLGIEPLPLGAFHPAAGRRPHQPCQTGLCFCPDPFLLATSALSRD